MKIIRRISHPSGENLKPLTDSEEVHTVDLSRIYTNPTIHTIYLSRQSCGAIQTFIEESLLLNPTPEVGGFLLGNYFRNGDAAYHTSVEVFVPASKVAYNSPSSLDFGTEAMLQWNRAQEEHPNLTSVAWFHTHPGHTPYLSSTDINLHEGFFPSDFQFALVVDPLTSTWDTGIFCRTQQGKMEVQMPRNQFLSWLTMLNN